MSSSLRRVAAHRLISNLEITENPLITADAQTGEILEVGQWDRHSLDSTPEVEFHSGILIPGLINAHSHLELSYLHGMIQPHCGHASFIAQMAAVRESVPLAERISAAREWDRKMFESGTSAVADICNYPYTLPLKEQSPIRYRSFLEVFGLKKSNLSAQRELLGENASLTPHSMYSISDADLRALCLESGDAPFSIHFMESDSECELFHKRGPMYDFYQKMEFEAPFLELGSLTQRLIQEIPADRSVMLVHCCTVKEEDIELIENYFQAPVYWVLCPASNAFINSHKPSSYALLRKKGCRILLGTDSLASNWTLDMLDAMKYFRDVPLAELVQWATQNAAQALGMDNLGRIEPGLKPGLVLIEGADLKSMTLTESSLSRRLL